MSDYELPSTQDSASKTLQGETRSVLIFAADGYATIGAAIAAQGLPALTCKQDPEIKVEATAADLCAYSATKFPCGTEYLAEPGNLESATEVEAGDDRVFIGGKPVGKIGDTPFAGVDLTAPLVMGPQAVLCLDCIQYERVVTGKAEIAALKSGKEG